MKKYAVISTDNNPDYYSLVPLTCLSWVKLGYTPIVICYGLPTIFYKYCPSETIIVDALSIEGVKDSTAAQVSRLFISSILPLGNDDIIIIGDADMLVMKDIFDCNGSIVSYGFDLTGHSEIPMCYVVADKKRWIEMMGCEMVVPQSGYSETWETYWATDQILLTKKAQEYGFEKIKFVDRGHDQSNHGLPISRWDRFKWENIPSDIIDVHMIRHPLTNWDKITEMAKYLFPNDNLEWLNEFYNELKQKNG